MNLTRIVLIAAVCFADGILLLRAAPGMAAEIIADSAPPPPRAENVGHRDGYVWAAGHWDWNGRAYRWVSGSWIIEHGKAHWIPDQWEAMGAQWRYLPGHWEH